MFETELKRAIATYEKKYKMKLPGPVQVEVYPGSRRLRRAHHGHARAGRVSASRSAKSWPWTAPPAARPATFTGPARCGMR